MAAVQRTAGGVTFLVRLTPKGGRDAVEGWVSMGEEVLLKARVRAVPENGKANDALIRLLAKQFKVPRTSVRITAGATSRKKRVAMDVGSDGDVLNALNTQLQALRKIS